MDRSGFLVKKCFNSYLIPMVLLNFGESLSEFVDSIMVGQLLGDEALVIVNSCTPLVLIYNMISQILGFGGCVTYADYLSRREKKKANSIYTISVMIVVLFSALVAAVLLLFTTPIAELLSSRPGMADSMAGYIRLTALMGLPYMFISSVNHFLTSSGNPGISSTLVILANVINVSMDFVYIKLLGMDVSGAALATFTGYSVAVVLYFFLKKETSLSFVAVKEDVLSQTVLLLGSGMTAGIGQLGLIAKMGAMTLSGKVYAGFDGQLLMTLNNQTLSIVSLIIAGVLNSFIPIVSTLHSEEDYKGIQMCMRHAYIMMMSITAALVLIFMVFPGAVAAMFGIDLSNVDPLVTKGFRIFSLMHIFRATVLFLEYYYSANINKRFSAIVSTLDSFLPVGLLLLLCPLMGIDGMPTAFLLSALICLCFIFIAVSILNRKKNTKGILMLPEETADVPIFDMTIQEELGNSVELSVALSEFLKKNGRSPRECNLSAILVEELSVYILQETKTLSFLDVLVKPYPEKIVFHFRNDGEVLSGLNILDEKNSDIAPEKFSSLDVIQKAADHFDYERILGMNNIVIELVSVS